VNFAIGAKVTAFAVLLGLAVQIAVAEAYTGGPVQAYIAGIEPTQHRVYYVLSFNDESGTPPQIWFFDLDASDPTRAIRARSLERPEGSPAPEDGRISDAWLQFVPRIQRLRGLRDFDLNIDLKTDSAGVDTLLRVTRYNAHLALRAQAGSRELDLTMFCDTLIHAAGMYEIPGRPESIVVLTYKGQAYYCELVDLPILIRAGQH
jgi:hypothetical protein